MRDNKMCNISHDCLLSLKQYSILNTKSIGVVDFKGPGKIKQQLRWSTGQHHLTPAVVIIKILIRVDALRATKLNFKHKNVDLVW